MKSTRVAVLRGGPSSEYDISMQTGTSVLRALIKLGYPVKDITISRAGEWLDTGFVRTPDHVLDSVDVVFLALHGNFGEDGSVQRILERKYIPFTGSRSFASALALNKDLTKSFLKQHGVKMPKHFKVTREGTKDPYQTAETIKTLFGPRYVVKPVSSGSSLGTVMVDNASDLAFGIVNSLTEHDAIMVEEQVVGKEATVPVMEQFRGHPLYVFPPVEIVPPQSARFFDYAVKYDGSTREICPGRFSTEEKAKLQAIASLIHKELGLQQYSRSDFIVKDGEAYFLEVNTLPGLTPESVMPKAFTEIGGTYEEMIDHLIKTIRV